MLKVPIIDILLVEDNPRDAELTVRALAKRNLDNPIHIAEDGEQALDFMFCRGLYVGRQWTAGSPKVVFLDLKLPKLSGLEVLRILKSDSRTCLVPVVIVTSSAEALDVKTAYSFGANSYVVKPIDFDAFMTVMGQLGVYWLVANQQPR